MSTLADRFGYVPGPIDLELGCTMVIGQTTRVFMYDALPGVYLSATGDEVSDEIAREAGFNLEADRRKAEMKLELAEMTKALQAKQASNEQAIRSRAQELGAPVPSPFAAAVSPVDLVTSKNSAGQPRGTRDYSMEHIGGGLWNVKDVQTNELVAERLATAEATEAMLAAQQRRLVS